MSKIKNKKVLHLALCRTNIYDLLNISYGLLAEMSTNKSNLRGLKTLPLRICFLSTDFVKRNT